MAETISESEIFRVSEIGAGKDRNADSGYFGAFADKVFFEKTISGPIKKIVVGDAEFFVSQTEYSFIFDRVVVNGREIDISDFEDRRMFGNFKFQAFWAGGTFVFGIYDAGYIDIHFVTPAENIVYTYNGNKDDAWYNRELVYFYKDGDAIAYDKTLAKYDHIQAVGGQMEYCLGRDELYEESGTVKINGSALEYEKRRSKTISEAFDMEKLFKDWVNTMGLDKGMSLDEFLENNRQLYAEKK